MQSPTEVHYSTLTERRDAMAATIIAAMNDSEFDRGVEMHGKVLGFYSWKEFVDGQTATINKFEPAELTKYELLAELIAKATLMDKECMVDFGVEGFCFRKTGKLVIFNGR